MPPPARQRHRPRAALGALALTLGSILGACGPRKDDPSSLPQPGSSSAPLSARSAAASAPPDAPSSSVAPGAAALAPVVEGVREWKDVETQQAPCALRARELEPNLFSGALAAASYRRELAMAWLLSTHNRGEGLVAFGAYDTLTRSLAKSHGLGKAIAAQPRVFRGHDDWTVTWFDRGGLVYAHSTYARQASETFRVGAIAADAAENTAIIRTAAGPLLGVAPVRPEERTELGLFFFDSPNPDDPPARALGATKNAHDPRHPALLEAQGSFLVAWEDASPGGAALLVARFDLNGRVGGEPRRLLAPGARDPSRPALVNAGPNVLAAWVEIFRDVPTVFVRALDASGAPLGPAFRVGEGGLPVLLSVEGGAVLAFVSSAGLEAENVFVVSLGPDGRPAAEGYVVSEAKKTRSLSRSPPALALGGDGRLAVSFAYAPEMRFAMKTLVARCLFPGAGAVEAPRP